MSGLDNQACSVGPLFARACEDVSRWPLPGKGCTFVRLKLLAETCRIDVAVGRLVEAHADALAILAELGSKDPSPDDLQGQRWAVWAAGPRDSLLGHKSAGRWRVTGSKRWCSGASFVTHALVDALTDDGQQLFMVHLSESGVRVEPSDWAGAGMSRADTRIVDFVNVEAWPLGRPGSYLERPGFWGGAIGVAACWHGATLSVSDVFWSAAAKNDPHGLAHLGRVHMALTENQAMLQLASASTRRSTRRRSADFGADSSGYRGDKRHPGDRHHWSRARPGSVGVRSASQSSSARSAGLCAPRAR